MTEVQPMSFVGLVLELPRAQIEVVDAPDPDDRAQPGEVWAIVRLIGFDFAGQITDIKKQSLRLARNVALLQPPERVAAAIDAHRVVLAELFEAHRNDEYFEFMPSDLVYFDELLALGTAHTVDDFCRVLRARDRLGRLLE